MSGANRLSSAARATRSSYVDPTPQRKGRPDDIAFRSMPAHAQTRYAAGLEKMSIYGIPATFGEVAKNEWTHAWNEWDEFGDHVFMSHNEVLRDGKLVRDNDPARRCHAPRALQGDARQPASTGPSAGPTR